MRKFLLLTLMCVLGLFNLSAQEPETITIGDGSGSINYAPTYIDSYTSISQQIFVADDMQNKSGKIKSVAFKCTSRNAQRSFRVYMVNTNKTSFNGTSDWVALTDQDLVYEGTVSFSADNWTTITFQTPFTYKKGMNVLLCVNDCTGTSSQLVTKFASNSTSDSRMLYGYGWNYDYADATSITVEGTLKTELNHVEFTIVDDGSGEQLDPAPAAPANLTATALSDTKIQLAWNASENASSYTVYSGDNVVASNLTATTYTVEGLTAETNYCYTVTAVKDQESEKSNEACATTEAAAVVDNKSFVFDFNDGTSTGFRVFQGGEASHLCPNWGTPRDHSAILEEQLKNNYKGVDGTIAVFSVTYDLLEDTQRIPDNYIVTENSYLITETSVLEWDVRQRTAGKEDQYAIVVSEDNVNFEIVWFERYSNATGEAKAYSLKDYAGKELYIGFRHYKQTNGDAIIIDNIKLATESTITPVDPIDPTAPVTPDNVKAVAFSASTIKLTWNAAENATKYNVYKADELLATVTETSYMVGNLAAETTYCFTVASANDEKESAKSAEVCATTMKDEGNDDDDDEEDDEEVEVLINEDFESYLEGEYLAGDGASYWTTWSNKPNTSEDAKVVELNGNKCAFMSNGVDQVLLLGGYQAGVFDLEFEVLIPEGNGGYLNVLHEYSGNTSTWAMQAYFQMTDNGTGNPVLAPGHGSIHAGASNIADIPCVFDAWMHFRLHINADTDLAELYYTMPNGVETKACEWQWSQDSFGESIAGRKLDAMDFFPMGEDSEYYVDNISLKRLGGESVVEISFNKESLSAEMSTNDLSTVELTVENTGTSIAEYVAWVDYGIGKMSNKQEVVSYADEEMANTSTIGFSSEDGLPIPLEIAAFFPAEVYATSVMGTYIIQAAYFLGEFEDENGNTVPSLEEGTGLTFRIYGQGSNGLPGKVLAEKEIVAEDIKLDWNVVNFDEPVALSGFDFYLAVEMTQCHGGASLVFDGNTSSTLKGTADLVRFGQTPFKSMTNFTEGQYYGNWQLMLNCAGDPVTGGWAELKEKEIYLQIGESKTITLDLTTAGLKNNQTYNAELVFSTTAVEEDVRVPVTLNVNGVNVEEILSNNYNIYPNPTTGMVTVEGDNIDYVAVYNSVGQLVKVVQTQDNNVDMSAYENGVYFFNVVNNKGENSVQRVVVAK